ncbi:hypothetical protein FKM82_018801 [Ascaphus truei]
MFSTLSWTPQPWRPLPASGAPSTPAETLSSMQQSSLTYANACNLGPSPQPGLKMFGERCPEISEARQFLSARCAHEEDYLDQLHPGYVPLSFLLQDSLPRQAPESTFCYPPAGSRAPYVCPKEQYV